MPVPARSPDKATLNDVRVATNKITQFNSRLQDLDRDVPKPRDNRIWPGQLADIGELLASGRIRPVIDKVFDFEQAAEALGHLAQGRSRGKVVVRIK